MAIVWNQKKIKELKNNPNDLPWDDLQVILSSAKTPASNAPTWRTYDFGLGGPAFAVLGFALNDYLDFYVQTTHSMKLNSILDNHVHGTLPSNDAGKKIKWQLDVVAAGVGDAFAAPNGSPFTKEYTLLGAESNRHNMLKIADVPPVNTTVSSIYVCRLTRIAASADDYGSEVYLLFNDCHFQSDSSGSYGEDYKLTDEYRKKKGKPKDSYRSGGW